MKSIIISGYYGFGNTGDEAILSSMIKQIKSKISDCNFIVVSGNVEETKRLHKVDAISRSDLEAIGSSIEKCDLVIVGGGGLFQDNDKIEIVDIFNKPNSGVTSYAIVPLIAKMHNKRIMYYAQGVGPLFSEEARAFVAFISELADIITVRDEASENLLIDIGVSPLKIILGLDPAFGLVVVSDKRIKDILTNEEIPVDKEMVCISVRWWIDRSLEERYIEALRESLDNLLENTDFVLLFVPFQVVEGSDDVRIEKEIVDRMKNKDRSYILKGSYGPDDIAGIISKANLVVGMRYHSIIFSIISKVPFVALSYDPKVSNLADEFESREYCLETDLISSKNISEVITKALRNSEKIHKRLECVVENMKKRLMVSPNLVRALIEDSDISDFRTDVPITIGKIKLLDIIISQTQTDIDLRRYYRQTTGDLELQLKEKCDAVNSLELQLKEKGDAAYSLELQLKKNDNVVHSLELQLKENDDVVHSLELQLREKGDVVIGLQETILQRENSLSWRFSQFYDKYFGYDSIFTKFLIGILNKIFPNRRQESSNIIKNTIDVSINEGVGGVVRRIKGKIEKPYEPVVYNPYDKLRLLKPIDVTIVDEDYSNILSDIKDIPKFSIVIPVKNEERDILDLLSDIDEQTVKPEELIIVDGGSKDKTIEFIEQYRKSSRLNIKLIKETKGILSEHRNIGIKNAMYELVILLDLGNDIGTNYCSNFIATWVKYPDADLIGGIYYPKKDNYWTRKFVWDWSKVDFEEFIPSAKSVLIKKKLALEVGGFPEFLVYAGEDTLFSMIYRKSSKKWVINKSIFVHWGVPDSKDGVSKKAYLYGMGDGENGVGDQRFYERVISSISGHDVKFDDPIGEVFFKGYLEGRRNRAKILVDKKRINGNVLILSGIPITDSGGGQRGTQIALELMKRGYKTTFCNVYPSFENGDKVFLDIEYHLLELYHIKDFQIDDYIERHRYVMDDTIIILESPHPDFIKIIKKMKSIVPNITIIYDCVDNWSSTLGLTWYSQEKELETIESSDIIMSSAKTLAFRLGRMTSKNINLLPNAVNTRLFDPKLYYARPHNLPEDENKIVMYTGALWGEWFDWELLKYLAKDLRNVNFIIIGNVPEGNHAFKELKEYKNVFFLGLKSQAELPTYLYYANVCMIPFKYDEKIIKYTNPLKVYEYLAMRKSVVSTYMDELVGMPFVYLSNNHGEFCENLKIALNIDVENNVIDEFVYNNSWIKRIDDLIKIV